MSRETPYPCIGPHERALRTSRSSVPCRSSRRLSVIRNGRNEKDRAPQTGLGDTMGVPPPPVNATDVRDLYSLYDPGTRPLLRDQREEIENRVGRLSSPLERRTRFL